MRALLARGVYPPPSQFEAWFPSLAHDEPAVERTVAAAAEAFAALFVGRRRERRGGELTDACVRKAACSRARRDDRRRGGDRRAAAVGRSRVGRTARRAAVRRATDSVTGRPLLDGGDPTALLVGDRLCALGLAELADIGDLAAVDALAI